MAQISVVEDVELTDPVVVEGFPGVGLVGSIAVSHLIETYEMVHYANVHCEGLPRVATYESSDPSLTTPVRLYADPEHDVVALRSDVPVTPDAAVEFVDCFAGWLNEANAMPIYLSGIGRETDEEQPGLYGVATGNAESSLSDAGIDDPPESGVVAGPTGALLADALERGIRSVGLIVESDPKFPDPTAARVLIEKGIDPIADLDTATSELTDRAAEIRDAKQQFAQQLESGEASARAEPLRGFQ